MSRSRFRLSLEGSDVGVLSSPGPLICCAGRPMKPGSSSTNAWWVAWHLLFPCLCRNTRHAGINAWYTQGSVTRHLPCPIWAHLRTRCLRAWCLRNTTYRIDKEYTCSYQQNTCVNVCCGLKRVIKQYHRGQGSKNPRTLSVISYDFAARAATAPRRPGTQVLYYE